MKAFIEEREVTYPMATRNYTEGYDHRGIPHCYLIDVEGKIAWRGHPSQLTDGQLRKLLVNARPAYVQPELVKVHALRRDGQPGAAYVLAKQLLDNGKLSARAQAQAEMWMAEARAFVSVAMADIEEARKARRPDLYRIWSKLDPVARLYAGVPGGENAKAELEELTADKKNRIEIDAGRKFAEARRLEGEKKFTAAMDIYKELGKRKGRTLAGKNAKVRWREMLKQGLLGYQPDCPYCKAAEKACASHVRKR